MNREIKELVNSKTSLAEQPAGKRTDPGANVTKSAPLKDPRTLAIDIGGSNLKAGVLDSSGTVVAGPVRVPTPRPSPPVQVVAILTGMAKKLGAFERVSVGFPGVVRHGHILTAPNLGTDQWREFNLASALRVATGKEVRILNDATVQGLGVISGKGIECVITLGTGFGFSLFNDGRIGPHLEMGQHPVRKGWSYDQYVGQAALAEIGERHWNRRVRRVIGFIDTLVNFDALLVGGGNSKHVQGQLPPHVRLTSNAAGITGGLRLWDAQHDDIFAISAG